MADPGSETTSFVLKDVLIFTGDCYLENAFVAVKKGTIVQIGPVGSANQFEEDPDMVVISRPNHTVLPGLIDSHIHALKGNIQAIEQPLRFGVTTVCDMHNELNHIADLQKVSLPDSVVRQLLIYM